MPRRYTDEQRAWIAESYPSMTNSELARSFSERFGVHVTASMMRAYGSNHRLRKSAEVMARRNVKYTDEMREFLRQFIPNHSESEIIEAFDDKYGIRLNSAKVGNLKVKLGVRSGTKGGRFERGMTPWNKGMTQEEMGISPDGIERIRATQFKRGTISGAALEKCRDLLDVRESQGYQFIKVAPRNKKTPKDNWIPLSKFEWMRQNGRDFPDDCVCVFANGDTRDYSKENLVPVPIDVYPIVSSSAHGAAIQWYDRQTLEVAIMHAKVIRERRRLQNHDRTCGCCNRTFKPEYPRQRTCRACLDAGLRARRRVTTKA